MIELILGSILIVIGIAASIGILRFAPGYHKVWGIPTGILFIMFGAAFAGWMEIPWFNFI